MYLPNGKKSLTHAYTYPTLTGASSPAASEDPRMSWGFFINHYRNETQSRRDSKYTYRKADGSLYIGLDPPADTTPYDPLVSLYNVISPLTASPTK